MADLMHPDKIGEGLVEKAREAAKPAGGGGTSAGENGGSETKPDHLQDLKDKVGGKAGGAAGSAATGAASAATGGAAGGALKAAKALGRFAGQHKKPLIGGGGAIGAILALVLAGSSFLAVFEAVHVAENVKSYVMKKLDHEEAEESQSLVRLIMRQAASRLGGPNADPDDPNPVEGNINNTDAEGFTSDLKANGETPDFASDGQLTGVTGDNGESMDVDDLSATDAATVANDLPTSEIVVNEDMVPELYYQDGVNFDVMNGEDDQNMEKAAAEEVQGPEADEASTGDPIIDDMESSYASTGDLASALKKGMTDVAGKLTPDVDVEQIFVTIGCVLADIFNDGFKNHYVTLSKELMRTSGMLFSIADQSKTGQKVSLKAYGSFVSNELNGNPNATTAEGKLNFNEAAGWKEITNQPVTASNPKINPAADPNNPPSVLQQSLQIVTGNVITSSICWFYQHSWAQWGVNTVEEIASAVVNLPDGESVDVADIGSALAIKTTLSAGINEGINAGSGAATNNSYVDGVYNKVSDALLAAADLTVTGNDDAVQFLNNADLGGSMSANTTARYLGGHRLSKTEALTMSNEADQEEATQLAKTSLWNQTISLANIHSVASEFLLTLPTTKTAMMMDVAQIPHLPAMMMGDIESIFTHNAAADADTATTISDSQQFGLTDADLNQYDIDQNSDYMSLPAQGVSIPISATQSVMVPRDFILGDPSQYEPSQGDLPNCDNNGNNCPTSTYPGVPYPIAHNALLGCFVDTVEDPSVAAGTICGDMLDFQESDNPTNISDAQIRAIYCYGVPSNLKSRCKVSTDNELDRYGKFLLDYHLSKDLMEYANAKEGYFTSDNDSSSSPSAAGTSGSAQQLAQSILANKSITESGSDVTQDLQDAANGQPGTAGAMTSAALLNLVNTLGQSHTLDISAIQSGGTDHCITNGVSLPKSACPSDPHYNGDAVDIDILDGHALTGRDAGSITIMQLAFTLLPSGSGFGQNECGSQYTQSSQLPNNDITFNDSCNHLHVQVPVGTP